MNFALRDFCGDEFDGFGGELVRLAAGRAAADGNQLDIV